MLLLDNQYLCMDSLCNEINDTKAKFEEVLDYGVKMRNLPYASQGWKESQINIVKDMAMAYNLVSGLEGISEKSG